MSNYTVSPRAKDDLLNIWNYFAENLDPESADRFLDLLYEKFLLLGKFPKIGQARSEILINLRTFPFKKYIVFYQSDSDKIEIVRVLHQSRDIDEVFNQIIDQADKLN